MKVNKFFTMFLRAMTSFFTGKKYTIEKKRQHNETPIKMGGKIRHNEVNKKLAFDNRVAKRRKKNKIARKMRKYNAQTA